MSIPITSKTLNLPTSSEVLGGPFNGYSGTQTITNFKYSSDAMTRRILRSSWNGKNASGSVNGYDRVITPFRAVNNLGDFLSRQNYVCGGSNQVNASKPGWKGHIGSIISKCDDTGVPAGAGNQRFVSDSSDYITYKRQRATLQNYNDLKNGGDQSNASYVAFKRVQ
jgi:hypothetical protein